jgi:hypothetical protein
MINTDGQLYTIEGFAAALIMITTAYLVINATSVYTAGDTHISDMQLEALGTDALKVMDIPENRTAQSELQMIITSSDGGAFNTTFLDLINASRILSGGEHAVRATKWVVVNKQLPSDSVVQNRTVLVEVLLWRD